MLGAPYLALNPTQLDSARKLDGTRNLAVADVGAGRAADFNRTNVAGKLVLATRSSDVPIKQVIEAAAQRGAVAVAMTNATPGRLVAQAGSTALPSFALNGEVGAALAKITRTRDAVVRLTGTPYSPYAYNLATTLRSVPEGSLSYPVAGQPTAHITANNYERGVSTGTAVLWSRRARTFTWVAGEIPTKLGATQDQWVTADPNTQVWTGLSLGDTGFLSADLTWATYRPGTSKSVDWFKTVNNTRIDSRQSSWFEQGYQDWRKQATLTLAARPFPDTDPSHTDIGDYRDTYSVALKRNGADFGARTHWYSFFEIPSGDAQYEATLSATRSLPGWGFATSSTTTWRFRAGGGTATHTPISVPQITYNVNTGLDNRVKPRAPLTLDITAAAWTANGTPAIDTKLWISYDDGKRWTALTLRATSTPGEYTTSFSTPAVTQSSGYVGLRTTAKDANGHETIQTVLRAFGIER